jgi:hypothetical protein
MHGRIMRTNMSERECVRARACIFSRHAMHPQGWEELNSRTWVSKHVGPTFGQYRWCQTGMICIIEDVIGVGRHMPLNSVCRPQRSHGMCHCLPPVAPVLVLLSMFELMLNVNCYNCLHWCSSRRVLSHPAVSYCKAQGWLDVRTAPSWLVT